MMPTNQNLAALLSSAGQPEGEPVPVELNRSLAPLLSEQLYRWPLKAIEELVVNSYDADALECRLFVPTASDSKRQFILVFDDGIGMDERGLHDLWQIGRSPKTEARMTETRRSRKQIGKFGIGKLAAYAVARRLTYITKTDSGVRMISIDFRRLEEETSNDDTETRAVRLPIIRLETFNDMENSSRLKAAADQAGLNLKSLRSRPTWTIAFLEDLKADKLKKLKIGYLQRVLSSAMPLRHDFALFLNNTEIKSSKEDYDKAVEFSLEDFAKEKLDELVSNSDEDWRLEGGAIVSTTFPLGITGSIIVTGERRLTGGKSADLFRSHGFFIYVRGRLINEDDPLFGITPLSHKYFNRFRAEIEADDLDTVLTAPREGVEDSDIEELFQTLLRTVFNYARQRRDQWEEEKDSVAKRKVEESRNFVTPSLVEYPVADVLISHPADEPESDADHGWFYLDLSRVDDRESIIAALYEERIDSARPRKQYNYEYKELGTSKRMVSFDPQNSLFVINTKHELVREHYEGSRSYLLEDIVTAEALLEIYLREHGVPASTVGDVLERRDALLRSLALDRPYSLEALSAELRDAANDQYDLEVALVSAARRLGFIAKQISGSGKPDGIARFNDYDKGREVRIILEAKSSNSTPDLGTLDYAGLVEHMERSWSGEDTDGWTQLKSTADGCLLIAPAYPGMSREDNSAAAWRAERFKISCWTIDQFADFVANAEKKHLTAQDLLEVILTCFTPNQVSDRLEKLLEDRSHVGESLYRAVIEDLDALEGRAKAKVRTLDMLFGRLLDKPELGTLTEQELKLAVSELSSASRGGMVLRDEKIILLRISVAELERRVADLLNRPGPPRRPSSFRGSTE